MQINDRRGDPHEDIKDRPNDGEENGGRREGRDVDGAVKIVAKTARKQSGESTDGKRNGDGNEVGLDFLKE